MGEGREEVGLKGGGRQVWGEVVTGWHSDTAFSLLFLKIAEAMEIMLIAVVSPVIRCEWQLENWQVALVTTVSACLLSCK